MAYGCMIRTPPGFNLYPVPASAFVPSLRLPSDEIITSIKMPDDAGKSGRGEHILLPPAPFQGLIEHQGMAHLHVPPPRT